MSLGSNTGGAAAPPVNGAARRDATDILAGVIRVTIGGVRREMPVLVAAKSRLWKGELVRAIGSISLPPAGEFSVQWATEFSQVVADRMAELIVSYDQTRALSGAKTNDEAAAWLGDNATDPELFAALMEVLKATFPFVADPQQMVLEMLGDAMKEQFVNQGVVRAQQLIAATLPQSSGPSTTGAESEAPKTSSSTGRTSKSSSSSKRGKSERGSSTKPTETD